MPGTAGGSWMALSPIWPITQAGPRCFSKGPGSNMKRDCLHRGQRPSGQERPISCWPLKDRHINSWVVTPPRLPPRLPPPPTQHHQPFPCIAHGAAAVLTGQRPWPWELHKQTRRELDATRSRLTSLLFTTLFLLFDFFRPSVGIWSKYCIKLYFQNSQTEEEALLL